MRKKDFLKNVEAFNNHRYLLWIALELTNDSKLPVVEFGAGDGSTKYLRQYCAEAGREFISYESDQEWAEKCGSILITDWRTADIYKKYSVVLMDLAYGEFRHEAVAILKDSADMIVIHDSEFSGAGNYQYKKIWNFFKYKLHLEIDGTGATLLSNKINIVDVTL